jgi:hypothetical protein
VEAECFEDNQSLVGTPRAEAMAMKQHSRHKIMLPAKYFAKLSGNSHTNAVNPRADRQTYMSSNLQTKKSKNAELWRLTSSLVVEKKPKKRTKTVAEATTDTKHAAVVPNCTPPASPVQNTAFMELKQDVLSQSNIHKEKEIDIVTEDIPLRSTDGHKPQTQQPPVIIANTTNSQAPTTPARTTRSNPKPSPTKDQSTANPKLPRSPSCSNEAKAVSSTKMMGTDLTDQCSNKLTEKQSTLSRKEKVCEFCRAPESTLVSLLLNCCCQTLC